MVNFLKLARVIINTAYIKEISIQPEKYVLYLGNAGFEGFMLFSSGYVSSNSGKIVVCKKNDLCDYITVKQWIQKLDK